MEESYVRNILFPVLRHIEIENKSKKYKSETFEEGIYLHVNVTNLATIRVSLLDAD